MPFTWQSETLWCFVALVVHISTFFLQYNTVEQWQCSPIIQKKLSINHLPKHSVHRTSRVYLPFWNTMMWEVYQLPVNWPARIWKPCRRPTTFSFGLSPAARIQSWMYIWPNPTVEPGAFVTFTSFGLGTLFQAGNWWENKIKRVSFCGGHSYGHGHRMEWAKTFSGRLGTARIVGSRRNRKMEDLGGVAMYVDWIVLATKLMDQELYVSRD